MKYRVQAHLLLVLYKIGGAASLWMLLFIEELIDNEKAHRRF